MKKKRIDEIDILKALGIICMVFGHAGTPGTHFIYLFHMAVFFMASGFFYKESASDDLNSVKHGIISKIRQLWFSFVIWNTIYVLAHNILISLNVYTDNPLLMEYASGPYVHTIGRYSLNLMIRRIGKCLLFIRSSEQMFGANWFIQILFAVTVSYLIIDYLLKKIFRKNILTAQFAVSVGLLLIGYFCYLSHIEARGMAQTASFYCLYYMGHLLGIHKKRFSNLNRWKYLLMTLLSFGILLILNQMGSVSLNVNSYTNPPFLILTSAGGWFFLYGLSALIACVAPLKNIMVVIGQHTMSVVVLHFLAFKAVEIIVVRLYRLPSFCLAVFPNLYGDTGLWWLAYTAAGVLIPVGLNLVYEWCKARMKRRNHLEN